MTVNPNNRELYNDTFAKIIEYLKKHQSLDIVEADLFVGISSRKDDRAVDVLVNSVTYLDDESFRIDYSEPVRSRREQFARDGISEVEMDTSRVPDRTGSIVIRPYSDTTNWFATPRDLVALLNVVKFTAESRDGLPEPYFELYARPLRTLPYSEMVETERRAEMFYRYYVFGAHSIVEHLKKRESIDLSKLNLFVYVFDRRISELMDDPKLGIDDCSHAVHVDRLRYRDENSFWLESGSESVRIHRDNRLAVPSLSPLDILRIRLAIDYLVLAEKNEPLPSFEAEADNIDRLLKHEGLRSEALDEIIDIGHRAMRKYSVLGQQPAE